MKCRGIIGRVSLTPTYERTDEDTFKIVTSKQGALPVNVNCYLTFSYEF